MRSQDRIRLNLSGYEKYREMLVFDEPYHLIFNECPERVIGPVVQKLNEYKQTTATALG